MKKLVTLMGLFMVFTMTAQELYFTTYNFTVEPQNVGTVYRMVNDYYSKNKPAGVTVSLYENHFNDHGVNFTHSIVFSGSVDALGAMYGSGENTSWELFITRLQQHVKEGYSSAMGSRLAHAGDLNQKFPFQRVMMLDVEDGSAFLEFWKKFNSINPEGRLAMIGNISAGRSPEGESHWIVNGFKDMKSAMAGVSSLMTDTQRESRDKMWEESKDTYGDVRMVRNTLRILLGQW
jgi:hypothetical protein